MRKIINKAETLVREMCSGIAAANASLTFDTKYKIISKKEIDKDKITLISGGGSGHEPAHAGFVGMGMLDAAVCGDVFASPSQVQVYQAIKKCSGSKGTLLIIKNYSGDIMNFTNGMYMAKDEGIDVDYVKVDDDIAVVDSLYTVGRRGVAGTVFVHKVAGAAANAGKSLAEVKALAEKAIENVRSLGFALSSCVTPAKGTPTFDLREGDMEFGVGIHGEPGIKREKAQTAKELAKRLVRKLIPEVKAYPGDEVAVLVNGFGGSPLQELYVLFNNIKQELDKLGIKTPYTLVGNYMTSIDMEGASLSLMKLDEELKECLLSDCNTTALTQSALKENNNSLEAIDVAESASYSYEVESDAEDRIIEKDKISLENVVYMVDAMSECIIKNEVPFCELDSHAGDGDFGMSIAKGFRRLKEEWKNVTEKGKDSIGNFLIECSFLIMEHCGGASGPIWGSAFRAAGLYAGDKKELSLAEFAEMMQKCVEGIQLTGARSFGRGAIVGDKTLIDALVPCADEFKLCSKSQRTIKDSFIISAKKAVDGAKSTENIVARMGRAGTVGERSIGYPDAGAFGIGVIFTDIASRMEYK